MGRPKWDRYLPAMAVPANISADRVASPTNGSGEWLRLCHASARHRARRQNLDRQSKSATLAIINGSPLRRMITAMFQRRDPAS